MALCFLAQTTGQSPGLVAEAVANAGRLVERGGPVMGLLLFVSVGALALVIERAGFWIVTHRPGRRRRVARLARLMREGAYDEARSIAARDRSIYGRFALRLIEEAPVGDAVAAEAVEQQRPRLDRFMTTLSTVITAAPMLGILGTVTGIIASFRILSEGMSQVDPRAVSGGIAEALLTTAAGLLIAVAVLVPYNAFRAQAERALGRFETLIAAASGSARERS